MTFIGHIFNALHMTQNSLRLISYIFVCILESKGQSDFAQGGARQGFVAIIEYDL